MNALAELKLKLWNRYLTLSERDRRLLIGWGVAMTLVIVWFAIVSPLWRRIVVLEQQVPALENQLHRMQAQATGLSRPMRARQTAEGDLRSTLFAMLAQQKATAELRALSTDRVEIRLPELAIRDSLALLTTLRDEGRCRVAALMIKSDKPEDGRVRIVAELERLP